MSIAIQECEPLASLQCEKKQQADDCFDKLSNIVIHRDKEIDTDERSLLKSRLNQLKKDQMAKRRAILASAVYDIDIKGNISEEPDCIKLIDTESPKGLRDLESQLRLPVNSLASTDFSNEKKGYRAAMFYDQREKKYIVAFRGTNKNNLIDWKNNINNQLPDANVLTAPSYYSANLLGFRLKDSSPPIEYTGHSKGGGEVYEALAASSKSKATVFNTAGPSPRISEVIKGEIASRTQNYQVGGEMLNLMQDQTDPQRTIENMKWLKKQVSEGRNLAINITERDNQSIAKKAELTKKLLASYSRSGVSIEEGIQARDALTAMEQRYKSERDRFTEKMGKNIKEREQWLADKLAGKKVPAWSPPFAASLGKKRVIGGNPNRTKVNEGFTGMAALLDHTMTNMHEAIDEHIKTEKRSLERIVRQSDPNFYNKLNNCSTGL